MRRTCPARDPARGWIATANQRVVEADYPHFLTSEWVPPYRQQRIEQLLSAKPKHSIDDLAAMQADVKSLAALEMLPWLQKAKSDHPLAAEARKALEGFDGTMAPDRAAYVADFMSLIAPLIRHGVPLKYRMHPFRATWRGPTPTRASSCGRR